MGLAVAVDGKQQGFLQGSVVILFIGDTALPDLPYNRPSTRAGHPTGRRCPRYGHATGLWPLVGMTYHDECRAGFFSQADKRGHAVRIAFRLPMLMSGVQTLHRVKTQRAGWKCLINRSISVVPNFKATQNAFFIGQNPG